MSSVGTVWGSIRMRTAKLKTDLATAGRDIGKFTTASSSKFNKLGKSVLNLRTAFAALAVGAVLKKSVSEFVKFEDALLDLQKVLSDSEGSAKQYIGTVEKLSFKFGAASSDVLQSAANFKQAGFAIRDSFTLVEQALTLTTIGEVEAAESSELLISILKGFKAPATEAARVVNLLNAVSNKYATNVRELGRGMAVISPIAKLMGFSFEETAGLLTPIIEVFRSGTEAGNALKISLLRLIDDNKQVKDALEQVGISQDTFSGKLRTGKEVLKDVQNAFERLDPAMKVFIAQQLAGARQAARTLEVFDQQGKIIEIVAVATNDFDSAQKELDIRLASTGMKIKQLNIAFNNMFRVIGGSLAPELVRITTALTNFMKSAEGRQKIDDLAKSIATTARFTIALGKAFYFLYDLPDKTVDWFKSNTLAAREATKITALYNKEIEKTLELSSRASFTGRKIGEKGTGGQHNIRAFGRVSPSTPLLRDFENHLSPPSAKELEEINKRAKRITDAMIKDGERLRKSVRTSIEVYREDKERYTEMLAAKAISQQTYDRLIEQSAEKYISAMEDKDKESTKAFDSMKNAVSGWGNRFGSILNEIMWKSETNFRDMSRAFAKMITEMIVQLAVIEPIIAKVTNMINNLGGGSSGGGGFSWGKMLSGFAGNLIGGFASSGASSVFSGGTPTLGAGSAQAAGINPVVASWQGYAKGGIIPGGVNDAVPIIAHGGEEIIPAKEVQQKNEPMGITVILKNPIDPAAFKMTDEEVVTIVTDNYARGAVIRKVIREDIG